MPDDSPEAATRAEFLDEINKAKPTIGICQVGDHPIRAGQGCSKYDGKDICDEHLQEKFGSRPGTGDRARLRSSTNEQQPRRPYYGNDVT